MGHGMARRHHCVGEPGDRGGTDGSARPPPGARRCLCRHSVGGKATARRGAAAKKPGRKRRGLFPLRPPGPEGERHALGAPEAGSSHGVSSGVL